MGYSRWSDDDWASYSTTTATKSKSAIFKSHSMDADLNPLNVAMREARDSDANPESTPIIVGVDVTGSMGHLAEQIVRTGLGTLFNEILDRKPVTDPQLMSMAIGDGYSDKAPLQVSQFEADLKCAEWLEKIWLEGNGGGNNTESYDLPYYFAANHTSHDAFEKRGKKGYLFTMGDEFPPTYTKKEYVTDVINSEGDGMQDDILFTDVIAQAEKMYNCFHIIIAEGYCASRDPEGVKEAWQKTMGQRAIWLEDHTKLSETIVSLIQVIEGEDKDKVAASWGGDTALVVGNAIKDLDAVDAFNAAKDVVRF